VDIIKEGGMGRACGKHGRGEKCVQYFCLKYLMEIAHLRDFDVDGKIIVKWILMK
jgi:hypothetical protein